MKKTFLPFWVATIFLFGLFSTQQTSASHNPQIGNLTYVNIAPNMYQVTLKVYFSCAGNNPGPMVDFLTYRAPGCDDSLRSVPLNLQLNTAANLNPYCSNLTVSPCSGAPYVQPYYQEYNFNTIISLPTSCPNWIINARYESRPYTRNLANIMGVGSVREYIYAEAQINNQVIQTNSSPQFLNSPITFAAVDKGNFYTHQTIESDGDSLVYNLVPALADYNLPVVYSNTTGTANAPYPAGVSPAGTPYPAGIFSATNPIISKNALAIDRFSGSMVFEPLCFIASAAHNGLGKDRYLVAFRIDEYRRINGVPVKIGHVLRDVQIVVYSSGSNTLPYLTPVSFNGQPLNLPMQNVIEATAGQQVTIIFDSEDDNAVDIVTLTSNVASALPGATFSVSGGARPTGTINWLPGANLVQPAPYFFNLTVTDNACPINGTQTLRIGIRVLPGNPTGISKNLPDGSFTAYPNPSNNNQISFKLTNIKVDKNAEVLIYNVTGKVVDKLEVKAGEEQIQWNKKAELPAGVYFARLTSDAGRQTIKLIHLK